jgi:NitT/TauT family transport system substrate-binding protein
VTSRSLRRLLTAFLSICAVLGVTALAACASPPPAAGGAGGTKAANPTVRLGFSAWPGWFPWQVAQEQGLFEKNGLNVDLRYFDSYTDSINALSTGAIDANSQTLNDTIASASGGAKLKVVLVNDNSTGNDQIIAREGINSVADLRGLKVGVEQGAVDHYLLQLALAKAGLTDKDIQLVPLLTDAAAAAFVAGQVDAVAVFAPFTTTALQRPGSHAIATSADFPGAIPDHLVVTDSLAQNQPQVVQALVNTWFDTLKWIKENQQAAVTIMAKRAGVSEADYETYNSGTTIFTRQQNLDAFTPGTTPANLNYEANNIADFLVKTGLATSKPPLDTLFEPQFVNAVPA